MVEIKFEIGTGEINDLYKSFLSCVACADIEPRFVTAPLDTDVIILQLPMAQQETKAIIGRLIFRISFPAFRNWTIRPVGESLFQCRIVQSGVYPPLVGEGCRFGTCSQFWQQGFIGFGPAPLQVEVNFGTATVTSFFCGNDDHTIGTPGTIDCGC
ncbi:hypothetical protein D3C81_911330 [compost metagenome]